MSLPRGVTALTVHVVAEVPPFAVTVPLRQLKQLSGLCRLDLRYVLGGNHAGSAILPVLPAGLAHLTVGVSQVKYVGERSPEPYLLQQVRCLTRFAICALLCMHDRHREAHAETCGYICHTCEPNCDALRTHDYLKPSTIDAVTLFSSAGFSPDHDGTP